jgi:hypothetical protein
MSFFFFSSRRRRLLIFYSTTDHVLIGQLYFFFSLLHSDPFVGDNKELTASKVVKRGGKSADAQVKLLLICALISYQ